MRRHLILSAGAFLLLLVAGHGHAVDTPPWGPYEAQPERLCGVIVHAETLTLEVVSNGCTRAGDFKFVIRQTAGGGSGSKRAALVQVIRVRPDYCLGPTRPVTIDFPRAEIGLHGFDDLFFENAFMGDPPL